MQILQYGSVVSCRVMSPDEDVPYGVQEEIGSHSIQPKEELRISSSSDVRMCFDFHVNPVLRTIPRFLRLL